MKSNQNKHKSEILKNWVIGIWLVFCLPLVCISDYNLNNPNKNLPKPAMVIKSIFTKKSSEQIGICSQKGLEEFIYFGTYRSMVGGNYSANFDILGAGKVYFDVVSTQGTKLLDNRELIISEDQKSLVVDFNVKYYQDDVELRLRHLDDSGVCINSLEIIRKNIDWIGNLKGIYILLKTII